MTGRLLPSIENYDGYARTVVEALGRYCKHCEAAPGFWCQVWDKERGWMLHEAEHLHLVRLRGQD